MVRPDAPAPTPTRIGPYRIVHVLRGDGVRGCARGTIAGGRPVLVRWAPIGDDAGTAGPRREHRALGDVALDGTPEAIELFETESLVVSVTGWIDGESLVRRRPPDLAASIVELFDILDRTHAVGWVHGDVTPSNVLVDDVGRIHLVDWDLAVRSGDPAGPGTLGYAPPTAWLPGFVADPASDCYAAGVVLAELALGRRLFDGDRASVLDAQRDAAARVEELVRLGGPWSDVAACLTKGGRRPSGDPLRWCRRVRTARLATLTARKDGQAVATRIVAAAAGPAGEALGVALPAESDPEDVGHAVIEALRTRHRTRSVPLASLLAGLPEIAEDDDGTTRADRARAVRARRMRVLREYCESAPSAVVVATANEVAALGCGGWIEVAESSRRLVDAPPARLVQLIPQTLQVGPLDREGVTAAATEILRPQSYDPEIVTSLLSCGARSGGEVRELLSAMADTCAVDSASGHTRIDGMRWESVRAAVMSVAMERRADTAISSGDSAEQARRESDEDPDSALKAIAWGEVAAIAGLPSQVVRACVRATTALRNNTLASDARLRLCDLWLDVGRPDAGMDVLGDVRGELEGDLLVRQAQCLVTLERFPEAALAGERLREIAATDTHRLEAARLTALGELFENQLERAATALRKGRRWRRAASPHARMMFNVTTANCWRRRGKSKSAVRLLHGVMRVAEQRGSVRLALTAEGNLILADSRSPAFAADRFERLAAHLRRWGLVVPASYSLLRAARLWMTADDVDAALRNLRDVRSDMNLGVWLGTQAVAELRSLEPEALDRKDAPYLAQWRDDIASADETLPGQGRAAAHRWALDWERIAGEIDLAGRAPRGSPRRAMSVALRLARRDRLSPVRVVRAVRAIVERLHPRSPVLGHVARALARTAGGAAALLTELRRIAPADSWHRSVLECVAVANCVWGRDLSRDAAWWVLTELPREEHRRPPGIRVWEFQLAFALAESAVGHLEDGVGTAEKVVASIEAFVGRMPASDAAAYVRLLPWDRVAAIAGVRADLRATVHGSPDAAGSLRAVRDVVRGARISGIEPGRRESGLRRVLRAALRLRATGTLDEVLGEVVLGVLEVCRAERALVLYDTGADGPRAKLATFAGVSSIDTKAAEFSEGVLERVRATGGVCIVDDAADDSQLGHRPSVKQVGARSIMVAPLRTATRHFGFLYVENRSLPRSFGEADRELIEGFAAQAALALENNQLVEELRASNRDLAHARAEAVRSENLRVLGRMAGEVAHDFNNLLTAILGEAQLLMEDPRARAVRDRLAVIERAALDGAATIRRIQDSTRVRTDAEFETVDLSQVARDVVDLTRVRWASRKSDGRGAIDVVVDAREPVPVRGIGSELREVLTNVVVNAVDAMPDGGRLHVAVTADGESSCVRVLDTGCGMSPEVLSRIFDPFFTTKGKQGNGLGLSIAHGIVKRHGGEIRVDSEVGRGTTMAIVLPSAPPDASRRGWVTRLRAGSSSVVAPVRRALVVDDDPSVLRVVSELLRSEGYVVETASGGASAVLRIRGIAEPYALVLTDLFMPEVNGLDVAAEVKRRGAALRTIVMSGCTMTLQGGALEGHSVDAILRKPFSREELRLVA